jgi:hypothetical protein
MAPRDQLVRPAAQDETAILQAAVRHIAPNAEMNPDTK